MNNWPEKKLCFFCLFFHLISCKTFVLIDEQAKTTATMLSFRKGTQTNTCIQRGKYLFDPLPIFKSFYKQTNSLILNMFLQRDRISTKNPEKVS